MTQRQLPNELDYLRAAIFVFDARERLVGWNQQVSRFYPSIRDKLRLGITLTELAEDFTDATYMSDNVRSKAEFAASLINRSRIDNHNELRQLVDRKIFIQHNRTPEGGIVALHTDLTDFDLASESRQQLHEDFLLAAESTHIGIWDWQVSADILQVNDALLTMLGYPRETWHYNATFLETLLHPDDRARTLDAAARQQRQRAGFRLRNPPAASERRLSLDVAVGPGNQPEYQRRYGACHRHAAGHYQTERGGAAVAAGRRRRTGG